MSKGETSFTEHAVEQMFKRGISVADVKAVIATGEVVEQQAAIGARLPRRLLVGWPNGRPLHVVCADTPEGDCLVVTTYIPNPALWDAEFKRRVR